MCSLSQYWDNTSNIFISNLSDVRKGTLSILMVDIKLKEATDTLEGRAVIQRDPNSGEMSWMESHEADTKANTKSCTWDGITSWNNRGW